MAGENIYFVIRKIEKYIYMIMDKTASKWYIIIDELTLLRTRV